MRSILEYDNFLFEELTDQQQTAIKQMVDEIKSDPTKEDATNASENLNKIINMLSKADLKWQKFAEAVMPSKLKSLINDNLKTINSSDLSRIKNFEHVPAKLNAFVYIIINYYIVSIGFMIAEAANMQGNKSQGLQLQQKLLPALAGNDNTQLILRNAEVISKSEKSDEIINYLVLQFKDLVLNFTLIFSSLDEILKWKIEHPEDTASISKDTREKIDKINKALLEWENNGKKDEDLDKIKKDFPEAESAIQKYADKRK